MDNELLSVIFKNRQDINAYIKMSQLDHAQFVILVQINLILHLHAIKYPQLNSFWIIWTLTTNYRMMSGIYRNAAVVTTRTIHIIMEQRDKAAEDLT